MDIITIIFMILIKTGTKQPKGNVGTAAAKTPNIGHGRTVCCYSSSSHAGIMMTMRTIVMSLMIMMMMMMITMMIQAGIVVLGSKIDIKGHICGHH